MTPAAMRPPPLPQDTIAQLPSPKGVALALTKACRRPDVGVQDIAELVHTDPALSGRLLALANAAAGGRSVITIDDAVARMGLAAVSQVALAFSLLDQHARGACANFNYAGFWNQSLLMAAASKQLGDLQHLGSASELFTVGLFAQVGRLALATAYPVPYSALVAADLDHATLLQAETAMAGTTHIALSEALMVAWGIPPGYAQPFAAHAQFDPAPYFADTQGMGRAQLAHAAWHVAQTLSREGVDAVFDSPDCMAALAWLGLGTEALAAHLAEIEAVWRTWLALLSRQA